MAPTPWETQLEKVLGAATGPGLTSLEVMRGLTGLEFLQRIVDGRLPRSPISDTLAFQLVEVEQGRAVFQGIPGPTLLNPLGGVHGGWTATLLDSAMACAVHSMLPAGQGYTTVELKLNLVRPIGPGTGHLRAEGKLLSLGRNIGTAEGRLTGEDGRLYAHGTETCLLLTT
jgi:uncharacterized protein (TIGR00369 family)